MTGRRHRGALLAALAVMIGSVVAAPGCALIHELRTGTGDKAGSLEQMEVLRDKLLARLDGAPRGQSIGTVKDLLDAPVEFDTLHVFSEGASGAEIREIAGVSPYPDGDRFWSNGNLLMFMRDGELVRWVALVPDLLRFGGRATWPASTELVDAGTAIELVAR